MKNELGITKGQWIVTDETPNGISELYGHIEVSNDDNALACIFTDIYNPKEAKYNAKLIAEAGTVANETGKTPRQLADDNKVLLEVLIKVKNSVDLSLLPPSVELSINSAIKQATDGNR